MDINNKLVSIILPVYNGADRIAAAIESVLSQTYDNFELVIVNDCSTDNTLAVLSEYQREDGRIRVISNKTNQKLPRSLNIGFSEAKGEYLTWTSDDNMYRANAIEKMVGALNENPQAGMVYADFTKVNELGEKEEIEKIIVKNPAELKYGNVVGACFMYRSEVAKKVGGYDPELFLAEDYEYWVRMWKNTTCMPIHEDLYIYRIQGKSLTANRMTEILERTACVISKHFDYMYQTCECEEEKIRFFDNLLMLCAKDKKKNERRRMYKVFPKYRYIYYCNRALRWWR